MMRLYLDCLSEGTLFLQQLIDLIVVLRGLARRLCITFAGLLASIDYYVTLDNDSIKVASAFVFHLL